MIPCSMFRSDASHTGSGFWYLRSTFMILCLTGGCMFSGKPNTAALQRQILTTFLCVLKAKGYGQGLNFITAQMKAFRTTMWFTVHVWNTRAFTTIRCQTVLLFDFWSSYCFWGSCENVLEILFWRGLPPKRNTIKLSNCLYLDFLCTNRNGQVHVIYRNEHLQKNNTWSPKIAFKSWYLVNPNPHMKPWRVAGME